MVREGRPFVVAWREADTEETVRTAYRQERDAAMRARLQALWLPRSGERHLDNVATVVGGHYRSMQHSRGMVLGGRGDGRPDSPAGGLGKSPWLTPEQQDAVALDVATGRFQRRAA